VGVSYCGLSEVEGLIPAVTLAATGTTPTTAQAEAIITAISAEIDMRLRAKGYAVPVTDPQALEMLQTVCMYGAAAGILRAAFPSGDGIAGDGGAAAFWEGKYQAALVQVDDGALDQDADTAGSTTSFAHGFGDGTRDYRGNLLSSEVPF
jgi:hypothetical protein